jgi:hypothetical protein
MAETTTTRATARPGQVVALAIAAILAACAGAPASSASPDEPDTSSPAAEATASTTPSASQSSAPSSAPTIAPDADLAALLPTTVAGREFTVTAYSGDEAARLLSDNTGGSVGSVAADLGVAVTDLEAAVSVGPGWQQFVGPEILAIRFRGADSAAILEALPPLLGSFRFMSGEAVVTEESIDGEAVSVLQMTSATYYFSALGDVAFIVNTPDRAEAEDALSQLP